MARLNAMYYYGGKGSQLNALLPMLPIEGVITFVDAFGGSAAVLLNRPPVAVEVYNDLNRDVVTFFRVLRERPEDLISLLTLTPYSREEYANALLPADNELERARRFYVRANQARNGQQGDGQWSYSVKTLRRGMAKSVSAWQSRVDGLTEVAARLLRVQIENKPALDVLARYDTPTTLFYIDPPYVHETRQHAAVYEHEMTAEDHRALLLSARSLRGMVAISGYINLLYTAILEDWHRTEWAADAGSARKGNHKRTEVLWTNYDPEEKRHAPAP